MAAHGTRQRTRATTARAMSSARFAHVYVEADNRLDIALLGRPSSGPLGGNAQGLSHGIWWAKAGCPAEFVAVDNQGLT